MAKFKEIIVRSINVGAGTYVDTTGATQSFAPLDIYLVPKADHTHDRYVVDDSGVISKGSGMDGDYIPTSGTVVGKPLTGFIETDPSIEAGFKSVNGDIERVIKTTDDAGLISYVTDTTTNKVANISVYGENISLSVNDGGSSTGLVSIYSDRVQIENRLLGSTYITPTTDNYYVQRKYITDNYVSNSALSTSLANYYTKSETYNKAEIDAKLSAVYRPKGSVANFAALPSTGNTEGDVWNVLDTGANYVWVLDLNNTGVAGWDKLSETVDLTNYMTLNTEQVTSARKAFSGATSNVYSGAAIETRGNGSTNTIYPSIGFHQPTLYGGTISHRGNTGFHFKNTFDSAHEYVNALGYVIEGIDDPAVLLADGSYKLVSDFALVTDLDNYIPITGTTAGHKVSGWIDFEESNYDTGLRKLGGVDGNLDCEIYMRDDEGVINSVASGDYFSRSVVGLNSHNMTVRNLATSEITSISFDFGGLYGDDYYEPTTNNHYVQKQYVDDKVGGDEGGTWLFP